MVKTPSFYMVKTSVPRKHNAPELLDLQLYVTGLIFYSRTSAGPLTSSQENNALLSSLIAIIFSTFLLKASTTFKKKIKNILCPMNNGHHFFTPLNIAKQPPTAGLKKQHKPIRLPITLSSFFFFFFSSFS